MIKQNGSTVVRHAIDCPGGSICRCGVTPAHGGQVVRMVRSAAVQGAQIAERPSDVVLLADRRRQA